jgi:hypothetical protein
MKKLFLALLCASSLSAPALAGEKITVLQATQLSTALRNLDGHMIVVKQNGTDAVVMVPWEFGSGVLRLRIANDISIIDASLKLAEDARLGIVKEQLKKLETRTGEKATDLKQGTPEFDEFQKQYNEMVGQPAAGTQDLARIKASELRLDKNEIPVTVLTALAPILEQDVK